MESRFGDGAGPVASAVRESVIRAPLLGSPHSICYSKCRQPARARGGVSIAVSRAAGGRRSDARRSRCATEEARVDPERGLPQVERAGSLAEQAYHALRAGIADGRLVPGERVTERGLAAALDVSPTPVREAIRKLEHEGLLERVGARGLQIVDHPAETLDELREVEVMLRGAEARFAARKITPEAVATLRGYIDELVASRDRLTPLEQFARAERFDAELARVAANPALRTLIESYAIYGTDQRTRTLDRDARDDAWVAARIADHYAIVDALEAHDEELAERIMRRHARSSIPDL
nr:GntR family transcriptional regulator [Agromyces seonyuensis]